MKVFLSWSGDRSRNIAETLRETLPLLMNAVSPWMSELDIDKGERWNAVISEALDSSKVGIFCLTPANVSRPAILFEAGAISKSVSDARVCVLLEGMQPSDLSWPWSQFQTTRLHEQKDVFKMLSDMNKWLIEAGEPALAPDQFTKQRSMWWPEFQRELKAKPSESAAPVPQRSEKDMLIEILDLLRSQKRESMRRVTLKGRKVAGLVKDIFSSLDAQLSALFAGCRTKADKDALSARYYAALQAYQDSVWVSLDDNDPTVRALGAQLAAVNAQVNALSSQTSDMSKVLATLDEALELGQKLLDQS